MNEISTPIAKISFDPEDKILLVTMIEDAEMTLENATRHYETINKLVGDHHYVALVDASNYFTVDKKAWVYVSQQRLLKNRLATAYFNTSIGNKIIANYFKTNFESQVPLQVFSSKDEALTWLKNFLS